jgi:23S rRNA pseudouridine955/2504/2580 synthase
MTTASVQQITIDEGHDGQRIDNFLLSQLKGVPKSRIYRILRKGEVRVNKKRIKPEYRLQQGDCVRIPPIRVSGVTEVPKVSQGAINSLEEAVLYEDKQLLIINKPSGMAVHGGSGVSLGVIEMLRQMRPEARFLELVHRLDRDTSGCLMIAKKRSMLRSLHTLLREGGIDKSYYALLKGRWQGGSKRVDVPLKKNQLKSGERVVRVDSEGKEALTTFYPEQIFDRATLVRVDLGTGRTHQIRVHAQYLKKPIAGDDKYGDEAFNQEMKTLGLKRLFLHAEELRFLHPVTESTLAVRAPLGDDLTKILEKLK